jgi:UPF0755 protein
MTKLAKSIFGIVVMIVAALILTHLYLRYVVGPPPTPQTTVTIPEGSSVYDEDRIFSQYGVMKPGMLIAAAGVGPSSTASTSLEGKLFPDTYDFYLDSSSSVVIAKMLNDFQVKAEPSLASSSNSERALIIASILEKEVASSTDQAIVAGIIDKRLAAGMPLDIDATICYLKQQEAPTSTVGCYPLSASDFKIDSPYNTYLYKGLPPTPISNPGVAAIQAALNPVASPYWYYLSDPKTGKTIYATTLAQQNANRIKYLGE